MKNRTLFLFSKGISHIGTKLFTFALSWYILSQTGSGLSFSISLLVNYIVRIHFSETSTETMEDKIKRMLKNEVRQMMENE